MNKGNDRRFYLSASGAASFTWLEGEQNNSLSRSVETLDISDKDGDWAESVPGRKSATADVTVHLDDTATSAQHTMLASLHNGQKVFCFIGKLSSGASPAASEGDFFEAVITAINDTNDKDAVASRQISLQVTGAITHYPNIN